MNNKVFYQHPNLMRVLGMHETVMEVMVNVLGAEKSQVMLQGEFRQSWTPWAGTQGVTRWPPHGWCPLPQLLFPGGGREGFAPWQEGAKRWDKATKQHPASVRASTLEDRGLFSLFPLNCSVATFTILCRPAPSQVEFLWAPLKSMVCVVLCQEKAVLNENAILIIILFFPCEPRSPRMSLQALPQPAP